VSTISEARAGKTEASAPQPLRILAVGNMYPPQHAGGYELCWQAAMRRARDEGHAVRVLTSDYRVAERPEQDPDVHRTLRWYWDLERYRFANQGRLQRFRLARHDAIELERHLREFCPDIVSWWSMGCLPLAMIEQVRRAGIPAVFIAHDDWLIYSWEHDAWLRTWRGRRIALAPLAELITGAPTRVDVDAAGPFVFNSRYTRDRARQAGFARVAEVVEPGIDERFLVDPPPPPAAWRWRLAYVGRLDRQKGIDTAIEALAKLPAQATLAVWGTGDQAYVAELAELADRLGVRRRISFKGFAEAETLRQAYAAADAIVFPVRWNEPFGLVPLEAMALRRPVVSTARGGTAEFIADGDNALVFDADDAAGLAHRLERLASEPALRARLVDRGRRTAERYGRDRFAERVVTAIVGGFARATRANLRP
jgi:glycogen(starch) synthase